MNTWPMRRRFSCGSVTPASAARNVSSRLHDVQVGLEVLGELVDDRFRFALAQQAVVDEDAGELRADRLVQAGPRRRTNRRRRRGRRSRGRCRHACADRRAIVCSAKSPSRQVPRQPQTLVRKLASIVLPSARVRHLGMELQAVERQRCDASPRRAGRSPWRRAATKSSDTRSTWSPWLIQTCVSRGDAGEQIGGVAVRRIDGSSARPYSRAGALCTLPPSAWHISCMP